MLWTRSLHGWLCQEAGIDTGKPRVKHWISHFVSSRDSGCRVCVIRIDIPLLNSSSTGQQSAASLVVCTLYFSFQVHHLSAHWLLWKPFLSLPNCSAYSHHFCVQTVKGSIPTLLSVGSCLHSQYSAVVLHNESQFEVWKVWDTLLAMLDCLFHVSGYRQPRAVLLGRLIGQCVWPEQCLHFSLLTFFFQ